MSGFLGEIAPGGGLNNAPAPSETAPLKEGRGIGWKIFFAALWAAAGVAAGVLGYIVFELMRKSN